MTYDEWMDGDGPEAEPPDEVTKYS